MFRIIVQRDTGNTVERGFFRHVTRIGDDALGVGREPAKLQIAEWIDHLDW